MARRLGGRQITLACLENREEMPALPGEIVAAEQEGIDVRPRLLPERLAAHALVCTTVGDDGRKEVVLQADQVILAIGHFPMLAKNSDMRYVLRVTIQA